jgi:hypothetical protein
MLLTTAHLAIIDRWRVPCQAMGWGLEVELLKQKIVAARISKGQGDARVDAVLDAWIMEDVIKAMPKPNGAS